MFSALRATMGVKTCQTRPDARHREVESIKQMVRARSREVASSATIHEPHAKSPPVSSKESTSLPRRAVTRTSSVSIG